MRTRNLLAELPDDVQEEQFETLAENPHARLLRIISPPHFRSEPFLQQEDEWVMVLQGEGILEVRGERIRLGRGDSLLIPAGTPHRVLDTSAAPHCIWLALHLHASEQTPGAEV
ncbi:cupin domain-containing protein [Sedimenticola hydrogenitrophicus]|uniref:cupin domain-containing protein n=1 Tax=Sedimenticola hydrogenitrophicus TaxID=2967975 RepID=UPI0023B18FEA